MDRESPFHQPPFSPTEEPVPQAKLNPNYSDKAIPVFDERDYQSKCGVEFEYMCVSLGL